MSEYYVDWRARVHGPGATAGYRFTRVVEELDAYPKISEPGHEFDGGSVTFRFSVDGFGALDVVRDWAERALRLSLYNARVGAPELPDGPAPDVRLYLNDEPTIQPAIAAAPTDLPRDDVQPW